MKTYDFSTSKIQAREERYVNNSLSGREYAEAMENYLANFSDRNLGLLGWRFGYGLEDARKAGLR